MHFWLASEVIEIQKTSMRKWNFSTGRMLPCFGFPRCHVLAFLKRIIFMFLNYVNFTGIFPDRYEYSLADKVLGKIMFDIFTGYFNRINLTKKNYDIGPYILAQSFPVIQYNVIIVSLFQIHSPKSKKKLSVISFSSPKIYIDSIYCSSFFLFMSVII